MAKTPKEFVAGTLEVIAKIERMQNRLVMNVGEAVLSTCNDVANHAKSGHDDIMAHAGQRYINRTGLLTASISPALESADEKQVTGIVRAGMEYAANVELGTARTRAYPYMIPALEANKQNFRDKLNKAYEKSK